MDTTLSNQRAILKRIITLINATKLFDPLDPEPLIGAEEDTSATSPPQITWTPIEDDEYRGPHEQPDDAQAFYETTTKFVVKVWGSDLDEATRLRDALLITGHVIYSPNAWVPSGPGRYSKGLSSGELGVQITMTVGLVVPIIYEEFMAAVVQAIEDIDTADTTGQPGSPGTPTSPTQPTPGQPAPDADPTTGLYVDEDLDDGSGAEEFPQ